MTVFLLLQQGVKDLDLAVRVKLELVVLLMEVVVKFLHHKELVRLLLGLQVLEPRLTVMQITELLLALELQIHLMLNQHLLLMQLY
ncbi:MAG: hypothetical protein CME98_23955 [Hyphomonas sp.]|nr:hypothetical protein [Hyphomonas sp.]MAL47040.1 hypothetical protein [Hyphomonas sp.]